jgi:uncharacterized protein (TIGR02246 family)
MQDDEAQIRAVMENWMRATAAGDVDTVLGLMTDDVVFMVPGVPPFGKEAFAAASQGMRDVAISGSNDIREIVVQGDWAFARNYLAVAMTPPGGVAVKRSGYTLSIFRKESDGRWRLARDANLLTKVD